MRLLFSIITISALKLVATHFSWYFSWLSTLRQSFFNVGSSRSQASLSARHTSTAKTRAINHQQWRDDTFRILLGRFSRSGRTTRSVNNPTANWWMGTNPFHRQFQLPAQSRQIYTSNIKECKRRVWPAIETCFRMRRGNGKHLLLFLADKPKHISSWQTPVTHHPRGADPAQPKNPLKSLFHLLFLLDSIISTVNSQGLTSKKKTER